MPDFVHLHLHTHYSLLDGLGKIDDIVAHVKKHGMTACAITDHGVMYGVFEFYQKAKKAGIKPILGEEMYVAPNGMDQKRGKLDAEPHHLTVLIKNEQGYKNLIYLTTQAHLRGYYYKPRVDKNLLRQHAEGLIALSGCLQGEVPSLGQAGHYERAKKAALEYQDIFGKNNFFLELQYLANQEDQLRANKVLRQISTETGIPVVASNDSHYVNREDAEVHDVLLCVQTGKKVSDRKRMDLRDYDLSIRPPSVISEQFKDVPEAVANTLKIAARCNFDFPKRQYRFPTYVLPPGLTATKQIRQLCEAGVIKRHGVELAKLPEIYRKRLDYELGVVTKMAFEPYFLIVQDFVNWARDHGIMVGPGRGSAAGSYAAYVLGITDMDPIKYDLLFERFLNPDRISMPDIDMDFDDRRRDEVIDYVQNKYGEDHVSQIITFGTMAPRAAVRDAGRALDYPYEFCDRMAKLIPAGPQMKSIKKALETTPDLKAVYDGDPQAKKLLDTAQKLEGVARHASTHACGVVITDKPIYEYLPVQYASQEDKTVISQFSMKPIEELGLLKMDFLGLKNLTIIEDALDIIKNTDNLVIRLAELPMDDALTYKIFQKGQTTGIFQFESSGMKKYLRQLKPTAFEDLISMVALYRPGPLNSGMVDEFIARKQGRKKITYRHASMKNALQNTYGVIVYQEQVMQLSKDMAGFTGGQADTLRKAMGKKIEALMKEMGSKFIEGCEKNSISKEIGEKVFDDMAKFAEYGFNRSHAACYALIAYQTAYLKAHYPAQFMAALMTSDHNDTDRIAIEVTESEAMKIRVLPPNINESFRGFTVIHLNQDGSTQLLREYRDQHQGEAGRPAIRFGLGAIKNVGEGIVSTIVHERKKNGRFENLDNFINRIQSKDFNKKSLESLTKSGALGEFGERQMLLENIQTILDYAKTMHRASLNGQHSLFGPGATIAPRLRLAATGKPADKLTRLAWEKELLGLYISEHPLTEYRDFLERYSTSLLELSGFKEGSRVRAGGLVTRFREIMTKSGKKMGFAQVEDLSGSIEAVVFPNAFEQSAPYWQPETTLLIEGKLTFKEDLPKILVDKVRPLNHQILEQYERYQSTQEHYGNSAAGSTVLKIRMPAATKADVLEKIKQILGATPKGDHGVTLLLPRGEGQFAEIKTDYKIKKSFGLIKKLEQVVGEGKVN